jgi:hypothetical protein
MLKIEKILIDIIWKTYALTPFYKLLLKYSSLADQSHGVFFICHLMVKIKKILIDIIRKIHTLPFVL